MGSASNKLRVFVIYDSEYDGDLYDLLVEQASQKASGFEISARSRARPSTGLRYEQLRREIREADGVMIICGKHTACSERAGAELRIAQDEKRPYFLLWGQRELACTKPTTAKPADGMYGGTRETFQSQLLAIRRAARSNEQLAQLSRAKIPRKTPSA